MKKIITFGTFDVLHIGHLNILERASAYGDRLFVGVSTDNLNLLKKGRAPIYSQEERMRLVGALRCVHDVFLVESLEEKERYICDRQADVLVMGDDWQGKFDWLKNYCDVIYLPRTPSISTTVVIERIRR